MHRPHSLISVMTPFPHFVEVGDSLATATAVMEARGFRQLPVKEGGDLVGLVRAVDITAACRSVGAEGGEDLPTVGGICRRDVLVVDVDSSLVAVVRAMGHQNRRAALVTRDGHLVGIVTATDLMLLLAELLEPPEPDDVVA
jgi:CBS domain-containing protein